jgi:nicotinamide phosphoribosyltransferase
MKPNIKSHSPLTIGQCIAPDSLETILKTATPEVKALLNSPANRVIPIEAPIPGLKTNVVAHFLKDIYKAFHKAAYDKNTTSVYSNLTPRSGKYNKTGKGYTVYTSGQAFVKNILVGEWDKFFAANKEDIVSDYKLVIGSILGVGPDAIDAIHIGELHDLGYLPVKIKALPEGTFVPYQVPCLTIESTHKNFFWLTNFLETVMSAEIWKPMHSISIGVQYLDNLFKAAKAAGMSEEGLAFLIHDFSFRGMSGWHDAASSGAAFLASGACGSDTIPAVLHLMKYYGANISTDLIAGSVNATEHAVTTSGIFAIIHELEKTGEYRGMSVAQAQLDLKIESLPFDKDSDDAKLMAEYMYYIRLMEVDAPTGLLSLVGDSFDYWATLTKIYPALKARIMARQGALISRPDTGEPIQVFGGYKVFEVTTDHKMSVRWAEELVSAGYEAWLDVAKGTYHALGTNEIIPIEEIKGTIEVLWDEFGGTMTTGSNGKEYKLLDEHVGAIFGDSITLERQVEIYKRLMDKGFAPKCALGIGSYTFQFCTRDSDGSAVKATSFDLIDETIAIYKAPKTDMGKKSAKGFQQVYHTEDGKIAMRDDVTREEEEASILEPIFWDGHDLSKNTLQSIRAKVQEQLKIYN